MDWSPQQQEALAAVRRWIEDGTAPQVFRLWGYAGTGKTTIAKDIYAETGALACAFTGKAASVMAAKGLSNARTVHSLIYTPVDKGGERVKELEAELVMLEKVREPSRSLLKRMEAVRRALREAKAEAHKPHFVLKTESEVQGARLVILDEASMVDERMGEDLLSFGVKVLVIGDPAQLPPVKGVGYFMGRPDYQLTEIHRQAAGNPIIRLATAVREGRRFELGEWGSLRIVGPGFVKSEEALAADQVLCGTNARRRAINNRHRDLAGIDRHATPMPLKDEKLVCLKNDRELGVLNGTLWRSMEDAWWEPGLDLVHLRVDGWDAPAGGEGTAFPAESCIFLDEEQRPALFSPGQQFTYGYCLTVHKSQGSQWDNVILFDDWSHRESKKQWLYTGVTRAAERLTLVVD